jgi:hypothetical protein
MHINVLQIIQRKVLSQSQHIYNNEHYFFLLRKGSAKQFSSLPHATDIYKIPLGET